MSAEFGVSRGKAMELAHEMGGIKERTLLARTSAFEQFKEKKPYRLLSLPLSPPPSPSRRVNGELSPASDGMGLSGLVGWTSLEDIEERLSE